MTKRQLKAKQKTRRARARSAAPGRHLKPAWHGVATMGGLAFLGAFLFHTQSVQKAGATEITVYKSPTCGCCSQWIDHVRDAGFTITSKNRREMGHIKATYGVKPGFQSCHTALVADYVVEGHVPAEDIRRLLHERPEVAGLAAPGMPQGSPGMEGGRKDPYDVLTFDRNGRTRLFAEH